MLCHGERRWDHHAAGVNNGHLVKVVEFKGMDCGSVCQCSIGGRNLEWVPPDRGFFGPSQIMGKICDDFCPGQSGTEKPTTECVEKTQFNPLYDRCGYRIKG